jgi:hypothetical protein
MTIAALPTKTHSAGYEDKLLLPHWAEVVKIIPEAEGVTTFWLKFTDPEVQARYHFEPGQFNMVYLPGYGEAAISKLPMAWSFTPSAMPVTSPRPPAGSRLATRWACAAHSARPGRWKMSKAWI